MHAGTSDVMVKQHLRIGKESKSTPKSLKAQRTNSRTKYGPDGKPYKELVPTYTVAFEGTFERSRKGTYWGEDWHKVHSPAIHPVLQVSLHT
jgi:hypothetical protein